MSKIIELSGPEVTPKSGAMPKQLVILLHGLGSDGNDLISLAPEFSEILPDAQFISPNAPFPCDMAYFGYQWFSLATRNPKDMYSGAVLATSILNHYIDSKLSEFHLNDEDLLLIGFSQGTMMSLHVGLRREKKCAGILGYSGALLLGNSELENEVKSRPDICLIHGKEDMVVSFEALETAVNELAKVGIKVKNYERPHLAHGIDAEGIKIGKNFMRKCFSL